jgi:hypothetical protein
LFVLLHGAKALNKAVPLKPWDDQQIVDPNIEYPYVIYCTESIRSILEAFLLASREDQLIAEALSIPHEEVCQYRHLFFDTSVFRTDLELIAFMQSVPEDNPHKSLYRIAFNQGLGGLRWNFCRDKGLVNPEEVIRTIMTDNFYRSLEHRGQRITGKVAKEAARLAKLSLECARVLVGEDAPKQGDVEALRFRFEQNRQNKTLHDLESQGIEEVLH